MDVLAVELIKAVFPWPALFSLFLYFFTTGIRRVVEWKWPGVEKAFWWEKLTLYFIPLILGALLSVALKAYPLVPDGSPLSSRIIAGVVAGGFSGFAFTLVKNVLKKKAEEAKAAVGGVQ